MNKLNHKLQPKKKIRRTKNKENKCLTERTNKKEKKRGKGCQKYSQKIRGKKLLREKHMGKGGQ